MGREEEKGKGRGMEGEGKGKPREKRRERKEEREVKGNQVEKWEGGKGNQVSGNFIHSFSFSLFSFLLIFLRVGAVGVCLDLYWFLPLQDLDDPSLSNVSTLRRRN